jgi:hypothetical protein
VSVGVEDRHDQQVDLIEQVFAGAGDQDVARQLEAGVLARAFARVNAAFQQYQQLAAGAVGLWRKGAVARENQQRECTSLTAVAEARVVGIRRRVGEPLAERDNLVITIGLLIAAALGFGAPLIRQRGRVQVGNGGTRDASAAGEMQHSDQKRQAQ